MLKKHSHLRNQLRLIHIFASVFLGAFIYSPWRNNPTFLMIMSFIIFPAVAVTGLWMWQAKRIKIWGKEINKLSLMQVNKEIQAQK